MDSDNSYYYKAFISYSREEDEPLARAIQKSIQSFSKPWYLPRSYRVFRDATNLAVTSELWQEIANSLDDSEWMILLASPEAAKSEWVPKEIEHWLCDHTALPNQLDEAERKNGTKNIIVAITAGEIKWSTATNDFDWAVTNSLPKTLSGAFRSEPGYADFRKIKSTGYSVKDVQFLDLIASIVARIENKNKDVIFGEHVRAHQRNMRWAKATILSLSILTIAAIVLGYLASASQFRAEERLALSRLDKGVEFVQKGNQSLALLHYLHALDAAPSDSDSHDVIRRQITCALQDAPVVIDEFVSNDDHGTGAKLEDLTLKNIDDKHQGYFCVVKRNGNPIAQLRHSDIVYNSLLDESGRWIATGSADQTVKLWRFPSLDTPVSTLMHPGGAFVGGFGKQTDEIFTGTYDPFLGENRFRKWKLGVRQEVKLDFESDKLGAVRDVVLSPCNHFASLVTETGIYLYDKDWGETSQLLAREPGKGFAKFSKCSSKLAVGYHGKRTVIWDCVKRDSTLVDEAEVKDFEWLNTTQGILLQDGKLFLYDLSSGKELICRDCKSLNRIFVSPNKSAVIGRRGSVSEDCECVFIHKFNVDETKNISAKQKGKWPNGRGISHLAWAPDGSKFLACCKNGNVIVWDAESLEELSLIQEEQLVYFADFSPDGRTIVTCCSDSSARIRLIDGGSMVFPALQHKEGVMRGAFSPSGNMLWTASDDGCVMLWDCKFGRFIGKTSAPITPRGWPSKFHDSENEILIPSEVGIRAWNISTFEGDLDELKTSVEHQAARTLNDDGGMRVLSWDELAELRSLPN